MKLERSLAVLCIMTGLAASIPAMAEAPQQPLQPQEEIQGDRHQQAEAILRRMLPADIAGGMASNTPRDLPFASELSRLAFENAFVQLWTRPGLSSRDRSLLTIGMLIPQGSEKELELHIAGGLRNGLSVSEIEEMIYHATAYAGFPRASQAAEIARRVVAREREAGSIE